MGEDRTPNGVGSRLAYGAIAHSKSQCPPFACDWNPWNDFGFMFLSDELCDIFRCFAISYKDHVVYLEPHRFITRQSEVTKERPGKELILDEASRISVRDKQHREKCTIQNELQLAEGLDQALTRVRPHAGHDLFLDGEVAPLLAQSLVLEPATAFQPTNIEQLLRCDRAAWMRLSELVPSLKRDDAGRLPLDEAFEKMESDPQVLFHLLPKPGKRALSSEGGELHKGRGRGRGKGSSKGRGDGKGTGQRRQA